jgi:phage terminase small subunit
MQEENKPAPLIEAFTEQQTTFIDAYMEHKNVSKAAQISGVSRSTAHRWLKDAKIKRYLLEAQHDAFTRGMMLIQSSVEEAVSTLTEIMRDQKKSPNARTIASTKLIEFAVQLVRQQQLEDRLAELEGIIEEYEKHGR